MTLGKKAVEGVAKLVEDGLNLVDRQVLGKVAYVDDNWTYLIALGVEVLFADVVHPCSAALRAAGMIVGSKDSDQGALGVGDLVGLDDRRVV